MGEITTAYFLGMASGALVVWLLCSAIYGTDGSEDEPTEHGARPL